MRTVIVIGMILAVAATAGAQELGSSPRQVIKNTPIQTYIAPDESRQGGDTIDDATPIDGLPFNITGSTAGYIGDYDEECPYDSMSPDVVYSFVPQDDVVINVDLCGSSYDTKTYIYDPDLNLIACNDDFYFDDDCGEYVSFIEAAPLTAGVTYYIVIDGYGGAYGVYLLNITEYVPCFLDCPADAVAEGEPPLHDGYDDVYNNGCSSPDPGEHFQEINWINVDPGNPNDGQAWMCGSSGWFLSSSGGQTRDTDWFRVYALETGVMEFTVESEHPLYLFKLAPLDCATVAVELQAIADCEAPATLTFPVTAGEEIWLWTGPTTFEGPVTEFPYFMTVSNNTFNVIPTEELSWGGVKALYR